MPECYLIAGSNGAGKTTFAQQFLPRYVRCLNFINPDLIAGGLSPFDPQRALVRAGRLVLEEIAARIRQCADFGFETTLSGRAYAGLIDDLHAAGYHVHMFYLWLPDVELALQRIRDRVARGGHDVPEPDVRRRYRRSLSNLVHLYRPRLDTLDCFDNATDQPELVFTERRGACTVYAPQAYARIIEEAGP